MKHKNTLCIAEWQSFGAEDICEVLRNCQSTKTNEDLKNQAQKIFNDFVEFAHSEGNDIFLKFVGKRLKAQNYVGLLQSKSGFCIEILPKTFRTAKENEGFESQNVKDKKEAIESAKNALFKMLKSLKDSPFKHNNFADLKLAKMPLLEIFILMFLNELERLIKNGLKNDYIVREENRNFLKGKLLFNQNLKCNFVHKERFFTSSDEFIPDSPPNRLIKSTLELLSKMNLSTKTSVKLLQMRFVFADIPTSQNIDKDLNTIQNLRFLKTYELVLQWCAIFLKRKTFTPYKADSRAFALLFDMNKLFESFVVSEMRKYLNTMQMSDDKNKGFMQNIFNNTQSQYFIKAQEKSKYLAITKEKNIFQLKPDIVGYEDSKYNFIADTKWKILSQKEQNDGISQNDLYQIFAYLAKYQCKGGFLIYPKIKDSNQEEQKEFTFKAQMVKEDSQNTKTKVTICFFDVS